MSVNVVAVVEMSRAGFEAAQDSFSRFISPDSFLQGLASAAGVDISNGNSVYFKTTLNRCICASVAERNRVCVCVGGAIGQKQPKPCACVFAASIAPYFTVFTGEAEQINMPPSPAHELCKLIGQEVLPDA